jgi:Xaa-Pro aminopeptidase
MQNKSELVPADELRNRMQRFRGRMDARHPDWELAVVITKINLYYLTGTMPDGMLVVPRGGPEVLWVRRGYERSRAESAFCDIRPMTHFRDVAGSSREFPATVFLESESVPLALWERLRKYFPFKHYESLNSELSAVRAVKSRYELELLRRAGRIHQRVMETVAPALLREGMSEAELGVGLFRAFMDEGHHGVARFAMFDTEMLLGHVSFGENSIHPTSFNGAGGNSGLSAAVPLMGSRERKLKRGDLVYLDLCCGIDGYHTDKTLTYLFEGEAPPAAVAAQKRCEDLQWQVAAMLKPGVAPSGIYHSIMKGLEAAFLENFMGYGERRVKFLGHGVGLVVDEPPVIADGFDEPLEEGMVLAVEPKKGVAGFGMAGIENTFLVTGGGGVSITGASEGLLKVPC